MRRPINVFGCTLEDGTVLRTSDPYIVAIKVNPDHTVEVVRDDTVVDIVDGKWVSYTPRTL